MPSLTLIVTFRYSAAKSPRRLRSASERSMTSPSWAMTSSIDVATAGMGLPDTPSGRSSSRTTGIIVAMTESGSQGRWGLLAAAMVIVGVAMGSLFSIGVFLAPLQASTSWSRTDISAVVLLAWVTLGIGSFLWGALSDRTGPRMVVGAGGLLLGLGLVLASRAGTIEQFTLAYGGLVGLAVGAFYTPLTTVVSAAFTRNRGLALGLISAGSGLGNFAIAPLIRWLITTYDWRTAMLLLGDLTW